MIWYKLLLLLSFANEKVCNYIADENHILGNVPAGNVEVNQKVISELETTVTWKIVPRENATIEQVWVFGEPISYPDNVRDPYKCYVESGDSCNQKENKTIFIEYRTKNSSIKTITIDVFFSTDETVSGNVSINRQQEFFAKVEASNTQFTKTATIVTWRILPYKNVIRDIKISGLNITYPNVHHPNVECFVEDNKICDENTRNKTTVMKYMTSDFSISEVELIVYLEKSPDIAAQFHIRVNITRESNTRNGSGKDDKIEGDCSRLWIVSVVLNAILLLTIVILVIKIYKLITGRKHELLPILEPNL